MKLQFLGANRQVTGSCYLLQAAGRRVLIDCGLVQERPYLERNWAPFPVPPSSIDALLLTHAHLDHCGRIPRLVREGFNKPIYTTTPSIELAKLVMADSARLQEEDAAFKEQRHREEGRSGTHPEVPLYNVADAEAAARLFKPVRYEQPLELFPGVSVVYRDAGHILGSAALEITVRENGTSAGRKLAFSGDLGLWNTPLIRDPEYLSDVDYLVMESTYGDSDHDQSRSVEDQLAPIIADVVKRGGNLVIPTFAIERAQEIMFYLSRLLRADRMPHLMVFLDSPMAVDATEVFKAHLECLDEQAQGMLKNSESPFSFPGLVMAKSSQQSKAINYLRGSCIIMAGAGMCTGGRIKHHLVRNITHPNSTILFVGYQSSGTLGREILEAKNGDQVRILGQQYPVRARIEKISGLSAHADRSTLLRWAGHLPKPPRHLFLTHGEEQVSLHLAEEVKEKLKWEVSVPRYMDVAELA